jgi:HEPN domain-containing protein
MGRRYVEEAAGRVELVRLAADRGLWATVVREAQEAVELFLKGALRLVAIEPARTHDVGELLRQVGSRFPQWFRAEVDHLAAISTELAGDRGPAYSGTSGRASDRRNSSTKATPGERSNSSNTSPRNADGCSTKRRSAIEGRGLRAAAGR